MRKQQDLIREPLFRILTGSGIVLLGAAVLFLHLRSVLAGCGRLLHILRPLLLGVLFATMLEPSFDRLRTDFSAFCIKKRRAPAGWIRPVSLLGAMLPPVLTVICVLIPQVIRSVRLISDNIGLYSDNLLQWAGNFSDTAIARLLPQARLESVLAELQRRIPALLLKTYDCTAALLGMLLDIGIGAVFSLYLLADKPRLKAQLLQIAERTGSPEKLLRLMYRLWLICGTFARFLSSQCRGSLILGVLCWLGMQLFHFPYPVLISAVIGLTNLVPYIGPLAGTIPCALLLLMVKPGAVLWFLLYIVILQQIESNLIYPRVVGHSMGLPPAWVLAAIVICGGLFGVTGMLLGVPLAAAAYALLFSAAEQDGRKQ